MTANYDLSPSIIFGGRWRRVFKTPFARAVFQFAKKKNISNNKHKKCVYSVYRRDISMPNVRPIAYTAALSLI